MAIIQQYHKDTDTIYVYESTSFWVPELGQSRSKRKCIGKIDKETGEIIPCGKRGPKKKERPDQEHVRTEELERLQAKYDQSQKEVAQLRISVSEMEKKLSNLEKQNHCLSTTIQRIRSLVIDN